MSTTFAKLNRGWNADPNAPDPKAKWQGHDLILTFRMGASESREHSMGHIGQITFTDCSRYRLGTLNDHGWYLGQGRFRDVPHQWGEFYELQGDLKLNAVADDWQIRTTDLADRSHFLFYFRDEDFECDARSWSLNVPRANR